MKKLMILGLALAGTSAFAQAADPPPISVSFTQNEAQVLIGLLDTAVKACGISCAGNAAFLGGKIQDAITAANNPAPAKK